MRYNLLFLLIILYLFDLIGFFVCFVRIAQATWPDSCAQLSRLPSGAVVHGSFPLVQGEGWDGVLLYALIVKTE